MEWIVQIPILFFSVVVHELCHGLMAWSRGDDTAERAGRLTLNPLPHIDPFGTVFLPVLCYLMHLPMFAWAKPVPVNANRLDHPRADLIKVAMVGPGSNMALAFIAAIFFKATTLVPIFAPAFQTTILDALTFAVQINLFLAFFNLVPVHPLDGSKVLGGLLPVSWRLRYERHFPYGMFIIVFLMMTKALAVLVMVPSQLALGLFARMGLIW